MLNIIVGEKVQVLIIGGGSMGCLFGALLSSHADVTICDINSTVVENIQQQGIIVSKRNNGEDRYEVDAVMSSREYDKKADLVIIFTKAWATEAAACTAKDALAPNGLIVTLQNGVGHVDKINNILGRQCAVAGVTAQAANVIVPGKIHYAGAGKTMLAELKGASGDCNTVCRLFNDAGIETSLSKDVDSLVWGKLLVNVGINALTAILKVHNGVLAEKVEAVAIMEQVVGEASAVAKALGIELPYDDPMDEVLKVCKVTAENRASMLQDILHNIPTEIDVINGAIVSKGRETGVETPANSFIIAVIKALEATGEKRIRE